MKTMERIVPATLAFAKELFTRGTDTFGAEEISESFGIKLGEFPVMPFSEAELRKARALGQYLILQVSTANEEAPLTIQRMHKGFCNELGDGKLLYDTDWYAQELFFTEDVPRLGWRLVSREVIPGSTGEDYIDQTQALSDYLANEVYGGEKLPDAYQVAVDEFKNRKAELEIFRDNDWQKCAEELAGLQLNMLFREKPVEVLYGLIVQHEVNHDRLLSETYTWTPVRSSNGHLVHVGDRGADGVGVDSSDPRASASYLGVRFSRSAPDLES